MQGENEDIVQALASADLEAASAAGLEPSRRAMLEFAGKITFEAYKITPSDVGVLHQHGYSEEQIAEVVYIAALFAFFNRVADAFGIDSTGRLNMPLDELKKNVTRRPE